MLVLEVELEQALGWDSEGEGQKSVCAKEQELGMEQGRLRDVHCSW